MKKIFLILLFFFIGVPITYAAYGTSDQFCAIGFGESTVDGTYTYDADTAASHFYKNSTGWWMFSPGNSETGYGQLQSRFSDLGQCYGNAGNGLVGTWSFDGASCGSITGVAPGGVTTAGACSSGGGPGTTTTATSTSSLSHDEYLFLMMILIVLLAIPFWRFIFGGWSNRQ